MCGAHISFVYMCVSRCTRRPESDVRGLPQSLPTIFSERSSLIEPGACGLARLANLPFSPTAMLRLPVCAFHHALLLPECWVPCSGPVLVQKNLTHWAISTFLDYMIAVWDLGLDLSLWCMAQQCLALLPEHIVDFRFFHCSCWTRPLLAFPVIC